MDSILRFLVSLDDMIGVAATIISVVSGIVAIVAEVRGGKEQRKRSWVWNGIIFVSILVIVAAIIKRNIVEVPDVVGYTYQDACHVLSSQELKYSLVVDNGLYVTEQTPLAGTVVKKNTKIELTTEPIGNNEEVREKWEKGKNVSFGNVAITFKNRDFYVLQEDNLKECFGTQIKNYEVKEAYLIEEISGVEYHDFVIEDGVMIFKNIPKGIEFRLHVMLEGYEETNTKVTISSQNSIDDTYSFSFFVVSSEANMTLPTSFFVADANGSSPEKVEYLSNVKLDVDWMGDDCWYGGYQTDEEGAFKYPIFVNGDRKIKVRIINPFDNGVDYECEIILRVPIMEEATNRDIIFLNRDGTCEVISLEDQFIW